MSGRVLPFDLARDAELLAELRGAIGPARDCGDRAIRALRRGDGLEARRLAVLAAHHGEIWRRALCERTERIEGRRCRDAGFCWRGGVAS